MTLVQEVADSLRSIAPVLVVSALVVVGIGAARWLLLRRSLTLDKERRFPRQIAIVGLSILGLVLIIIALPASAETRDQLLTVVGLISSGIIALASTTIVANAMAGVMLRTSRSFRIGDFIRVGEQFGRVTERGLLDTEIQTEDRELTTLPNLFLISNPVTVVRTSGTLISVNLSLGYDVHHVRVEHLLIEAARRAHLDEPFVRIIELGNYSVTYRVSGFLSDIKYLLTARSNLCRAVLDVLHGDGVEIMSPSFRTQRRISADTRIIPIKPIDYDDVPEDDRTPEELMFDKAARAERIELIRLRLERRIADLESNLKSASDNDRSRLTKELDHRKKQLEAIVNGPDTMKQ